MIFTWKINIKEDLKRSTCVVSVHTAQAIPSTQTDTHSIPNTQGEAEDDGKEGAGHQAKDIDREREEVMKGGRE